SSSIFLSNYPASTEIYPLSLHDALPICFTPSFRCAVPPTSLLPSGLCWASAAGCPVRPSRSPPLDIWRSLLASAFQLHGIRSSLPKSGQQKGPHTGGVGPNQSSGLQKPLLNSIFHPLVFPPQNDEHLCGMLQGCRICRHAIP